MLPDIVTTTNVAVALVGLIFGGGVTAMYHRRVALRVAEDVAELEAQAQENLDEDATGYGVEIDPPDVGRNLLDVFRAWRHLSVQERMAKRGYVKWFRVGARLHAPKWVKPEHKDTGQREYHHKGDDQTYVFPEEAMVTDGRTSAYVAVHKVGEAEPIDLRNPGYATLGAGTLQKLIDMAIARDPPSGLSGLPLSSTQLRYLGIAVLGLGIWAFTQFSGVF